LLFPDEVDDHKTVKKMKYALSPAALKEAWPMLIYAKVCVEERRAQGLQPPPYILLRHNAYCKDPQDMRVRKIEARVSIQEIDDAWKEIEKMCADMVIVRDRVNTWHEIREPKNMNQTCNKYGGCAFIPICAGLESEQAYENRLAGAAAGGYAPITV